MKQTQDKRSHKRIGTFANPLKVRIKKLYKDSKLPTYAHDADAGMDLYAHSKTFDPASGNLVYGTGIAVEIPKGYVGLVFPRSSVYKTQTYMTNSVGVIDSGYRGEVMARFEASNKTTKFQRLKDRIHDFLFMSVPAATGKGIITSHCTRNSYNVGERIAQLIILPYPKVQLIETDTLSDSDRGTNGHGSTGNN